MSKLKLGPCCPVVGCSFRPVLNLLSLEIKVFRFLENKIQRDAWIAEILSPAKKSKTKMPSLVKKWQSIQKELDEEEKSSSSDEDRDQLNNRRIEEWKQQQLTTGKAGKNANFEALPDDWRERLLKKRKMMQSS